MERNLARWEKRICPKLLTSKKQAAGLRSVAFPARRKFRKPQPANARDRPSLDEAISGKTRIEIVSEGSEHEPFCTVLRLWMSESISTSREQFARQTRRPLFSLEAIQPRRRVLVRLQVISSRPFEKGRVVVLEAQEYSGLGPSRGLPGG
jgi:hypothetical protein